LGFCGWGDAFGCAETHPTFNLGYFEPLPGDFGSQR
jgi:hypothetical protein